MKQKSNQERLSRSKHSKTKVTSTIVKFKTKDGRLIQVKGLKTKKVSPKAKKASLRNKKKK